MLVGRPVAMHPVPALATGRKTTEAALTVTPPPGVQFVMLATPTGLAMAWLEKPRNAIPAMRYKRWLSRFIVLLLRNPQLVGSSTLHVRLQPYTISRWSS